MLLQKPEGRTLEKQKDHMRKCIYLFSKLMNYMNNAVPSISVNDITRKRSLR